MTVLTPTRRSESNSHAAEQSPPLRLAPPGTRERRPWQAALGLTLVLACAALAAGLFQSSAHRVSVVVATRDLPAGHVIVASDLGTASIPSSGGVTAMAASGDHVLVGQPLSEPVYAGEVLVRQMIARTPRLGAGQQVAGVLLEADQMPSVGLAPDEQVQVTIVPQSGQGSTVGNVIGSVLVAEATVYSVSPAPPNSSQEQEWVSLVIPASDAASVTAYAAAGQLGLSLLSSGANQ